MPLSEFYRMAKLNLESGQETTAARPADLSFVPDNEFFELVWENGQITMQGQSSRARKNPTSNNAPSQAARLRDKDLGYATASKMGKDGAMDPMLNEISMSVPSVEIGSSEDDDMVPWLNYPIDDTLQQYYCSELLPELSGVTVNEPSGQHSFPIVDKRGSFHQRSRDSLDVPVKNGARSEHGIPSKVSPTRTSQIPCSLQQGQTSVPSPGSGVSGIFRNNTSNIQHAVYGPSMQGQASADGVSSMKMQKQDPVLSNRNSSLLNFSHFSRPAAIVRANLQSIDTMAAPGSSVAEGMVNKDKGSMSSNCNPVESTLIDPSTDAQKKIRSHRECIIVPGKVKSKPVAMKPMELCPAEQSSAAFHANVIKDDKCPNHIIGGSTSRGLSDAEKAVEPVVASSSVCSGNSVERASNDLAHNLKRKCCDTESECRSEDVEEESVAVRKAAPARGVSSSKRSRAAEVHNLSERRRRDRINEKMRALQELIPNCNKVDKASMLDEAIEYLKTLQLQVQIMSMGASLCMSPMMLPTGMQHMHLAHMPHFSPMGVGMGMGFGYGMGMLDLNGRTAGTPGCPMIPLPPMQGAHFPSPPIAGATSFQGVAGTNLQVFGHPGHGLPMSVPQAPFMPLSGPPPINSSMGFSASRTGFNVDIPNSAPPSNSKDLMQNANSEVMCNDDATSSMNQTSSKFQETNEGIQQPALVHKNNQVPDASGSTDVNSK